MYFENFKYKFLIFPCCDNYIYIYDFNENSFRQGSDRNTLKFIQNSCEILIGNKYYNIDEGECNIKEYELYELTMDFTHSYLYHIPLK